MFLEINPQLDPIVKLFGEWWGQINIGTILIRMALCIAFASLIGIERSSKRHSAGFRTFLLVTLAGCVSSLLDVYFISMYLVFLPILSAGLIIAIAIISANTLLYSSKSQIKGLTTAIALWTMVFVGLSIGAGFYTVGLISGLLLFIILNVLPTLEVYLKDRSNHFEIHLELKNKNDLQQFTATIRKLGLHIDDIENNPAYVNSGLSVYTISLSITSDELKKYKTHSEIIEALSSLEYVNCIEEIK